MTLTKLNKSIIDCRQCDRLVNFREKIATEKRKQYKHEIYWGKPITGYGDHKAKLLMVGLAPAAHGGNRTGRVFTGDRSADFLFKCLFEAGFCNQSTSINRSDGLILKDLYLTTPCVGGHVNDLTVAAAKVAGIKNIARLGGAQSIAAFSFGTESIPKVDKIIGPGNSYVAEAKRQLFGVVGIDSIAGPSEIVILANETSSPEIVAWDLMAQAEHDEDASSILISTSSTVIQQVKEIIGKECSTLERAMIIKSSLKNNGLIVKIDNYKQAITLINRLAPEHLHLAFNNQEIDVKELVAGITLEGIDSAVSLSDYVLGPSHILPTNSSSRFSSPLSVEDFLISSSKVAIKSESNTDLYNKLVENTSIIARAEGLTAHAISVEKRKKD